MISEETSMESLRQRETELHRLQNKFEDMYAILDEAFGEHPPHSGEQYLNMLAKVMGVIE